MKKKKLLIAGIVLLLGLIFVFFSIIKPGLALYKETNIFLTNATKMGPLVKTGDLEKIKTTIPELRQNLREVEKKLRQLSWLKAIPYFGDFVKDGDRFVSIGYKTFDLAETTIDVLTPYADLLGLKGKGMFSGRTAEQRVQMVVTTLSAMTPQAATISGQLRMIKEDLTKVNADKYPEKIGKIALKKELQKTKDLVGQLEALLSKFSPAVVILPEALGQKDPKTYLILFQNDKELRPTGGFLTAYALIKVDKGKIIPLRSDDIYNLDSAGRLPLPEPIKKYLPGVNRWYIRDTNLSPDFSVSMKTFWEFWERLMGTGKIDGIAAVDTYLVVKILEAIGPVNALGINFTAENDKRCDCPQVVYELEAYATVVVNYLRPQRKAVLGELMNAILVKSLQSSPREIWPKLSETIFSAANEKHALFYSRDKTVQEAVEKLGWGGRIVDFPGGDYLHINDTNFAGAKSNMFVQESVEQKIETANDGTVTDTVNIVYKNPRPYDDCNLERGGLCLNGLYRDWMRVYVPKGSKLISSSGSETEVVVGEDLGKTVFEARVDVRPLGSARLTFKYQLPFSLKKNEEYRLLIQKQPGTDGHEYSLTVAGKTEKFPLREDREFKIKL